MLSRWDTSTLFFPPDWIFSREEEGKMTNRNARERSKSLPNSGDSIRDSSFDKYTKLYSLVCHKSRFNGS